MMNRRINTMKPKMLMLGVHYLNVSGSGNPMPTGTACVQSLFTATLMAVSPSHPRAAFVLHGHSRRGLFALR